MSVPQTTIWICSGVPLNSRYDHTIYFPSVDEQFSYFSGKVVKSLSAYSYVRKSWELKVEGTMEQARRWNYLFFRNTETGKVWYYFINNIEYLGENSVKLFLELDVMQSYLREYTLLPCFVEREHTETDAVGEHTVLENLEMGDYTIQGENDVLMLYANMCVVIQATKRPGSLNISFGGSLDDVYSGLGVYAVERKHWGQLTELLGLMSGEEWGDIDAIVNMWMYPQELIKLKDGQSWGDETVVKDVRGVETYTCSFSKNVAVLDASSGNPYEPRNKKLLCYPYSFMYVTNNSGGSAVYKYERFSGEKATFHVEGTVSPDASVNLVPENYNGVEHNYDESLGMGGFPTCAWNADMYKIWLAQNQNTHNLAMSQAKIAMVGSAIGGIASLGMGNVAGALGAGLGIYHSYNQIQNLMVAKMDKAVEPPQARGTHSASVNYANDAHTYFIYNKCINREHAEMLDSYFDMFGYQINAVKIPNTHSRPYYNFVKTQGCHIKTNICNEDAKQIEGIFDKGITFWKDGDKVGNYEYAKQNAV